MTEVFTPGTPPQASHPVVDVEVTDETFDLLHHLADLTGLPIGDVVGVAVRLYAKKEHMTHLPTTNAH